MDRDLDVRDYTDFEELDLPAMTAAEIKREIDLRKTAAVQIAEQLRSDREGGYGRDPDWRMRAGSALRHLNEEIVVLKGERMRLLAPMIEGGAAKKERRRVEAVRLELFKEETAARKKAERQATAAAAEAKRKAAFEVMKAAMDAKTERERIRMAAHLRSEAQSRKQRGLFVRAAARVLDETTFKAIWDEARRLWPDEPCWDREALK